MLKAGQIPCTISSIIGPECTGNCTITNLIDAPGGGTLDGRSCDENITPTIDIPGRTDEEAIITVGTQERQIRFLGCSPNTPAPGSTRFYYCVVNNYSQSGPKKGDCGSNNCHAAISHISLFPLECGENNCVDFTYTLDPVQPTCTTPTGKITVNGTDGLTNPIISYSQNDAQGAGYDMMNSILVVNNMVSGLTPNKYYTFRVFTEIDGCFTDKEVFIEDIPANPSFGLTPTDPTCGQSTGSIDITGTLPTNKSIFYSMGDVFDPNNKVDVTNTDPVSGLTPGDYTFRLTDEDTGCFTDQMTTINPAPGAPTFDLEAMQPECVGEVAEGSIEVKNISLGSGYTLSYSPGMPYVAGSSVDITSGPNPVTGLAPGFYTFRLTRTSDGCFTDKVIQLINPEEPSFGLDPTRPGCDGTPGGTVTVTGTLPVMNRIEYKIGGINVLTPTMEATTNPVTGLSPGTYTFYVTNIKNGCTTGKEVTIDDAPLSPNIIIEAVSPECGELTGSITISDIGEDETVLYSSGTMFNELNFMTLVDDGDDGTETLSNLAIQSYTFRVVNDEFTECFTDYTRTLSPPPTDCYGYNAEDPCKCYEEGIFEETVRIMGPAGQTLTIDFDDAIPDTLAGKQFEEVEDGVYEITFFHAEGVGFSFYVIDNSGMRIRDTDQDQVIRVFNNCEDPEIEQPEIIQVCNEEDIIDLNTYISNTDGDLTIYVKFGDEAFQELPDGLFNPGNRPLGTYTIKWVFESYASPSLSANDPSNPGQPGDCLLEREVTFELIDCSDLPVMPGH